MALKKTEFALRSAGFKVSPDELDQTIQYVVAFPGTSQVWFGTPATGTQGQSKAHVVTNKLADYPRNVKVACAGSSGSTVGGTYVVNGKDQFGNTIQESIVLTTAADGGTRTGTMIFSEVTSGTFNFSSTMNAGPGTPQLGLGTGGTAVGSLQCLFGLPVKIGAVADVKNITWVNNTTTATFNGGSINGTHVGTANHTFNGTAVVVLTDKYLVTVKSSYVAEENYQLL